jgi:hypothetical protein
MSKIKMKEGFPKLPETLPGLSDLAVKMRVSGSQLWPSGKQSQDINPEQEKTIADFLM